MAAPQIPNLLSLRNPKTPGRGRARTAEASSSTAFSVNPPRENGASKDKTVQQTDQDATVSRLSAVEAGYLDDDFAKEFAEIKGQKRFPIINRGTYVRTQAIDKLVDSFLSRDPAIKKQVISLGAGSDTRFFRLASRSPPPNMLYHEIDFPANIQHKISVLRKSSRLSSCIGTPLSISSDDDNNNATISTTMTTTASTAFPTSSCPGLSSPTYHLYALDLRTLSTPSPPHPSSTLLSHIDPFLPTLLLSECCLIYLPPSTADAVVHYFTTHLFPRSTPLSLILYEPINPFDAFGRTMVSNLAARGIVLQTLHAYGSLERQKERLRRYGFDGGQAAVDVDFLFERWLGDAETERVCSVEMLDEVEEWKLLAGHYCVAWGWRDGEGGKAVWEGWRGLAAL